MALTPDDVVIKQFQHVRFKEGFDPDEVDDFLDEVVVEWRKVIAENEELKARIAELESGEAPAEAPSADATAPAAGIIGLAQRLHDEHVAEGIAQRDKLAAEGESALEEARTQAAEIVAEAEERRRAELERLEGDRDALESTIGDLRQFESDYRSQLRSFIESKLEDLDGDLDADADDDASSDDD
ncbi:DivIVA domain-containing protein [Microbacterium sp.]|uniref:DivIVA domain-containing protein n=1 Tax=Microbacterium sp. TaxID=51671 RepID=UPI003221C7FE